MVVLRSWAARRWYVLTAAALAALLAAGLLGAAPGKAFSTAPAGTHFAVAKTGHVGAGRLVQAATSNKPFVPTAAQKAARARDMKMLASLPKAPIGRHTTAANVARLTGPQTSLTAERGATVLLTQCLNCTGPL